jgi:hypothetical protein
VALGQELVGHIEQFLEITVPRCQPKLRVKHGHAINHVVEGDPQLLLALTDFVEEPRILHRDHRLGGEVFEQCYLFLCERTDFLAIYRKGPQLSSPRSMRPRPEPG